jgi:hypothetical protein
LLRRRNLSPAAAKHKHPAKWQSSHGNDPHHKLFYFDADFPLPGKQKVQKTLEDLPQTNV